MSNNNVWSATQMAGTGGALKALAKNLSNQLPLNPTEMKRVVARVISDCHYQGQVGDYNGHTFYLNPERIDMNKQITDSKEAFDDMVEQKRSARSRKTSQQSPSSSRSRSLTCRLAVNGKPKRSLTGVMIKSHHLRHPTTDIVVEMPHTPSVSPKCKTFMKRKPAIAPIKRSNNKFNNNNNNHNTSRVQAAVRPKPKPKVKLMSKSLGKMQSVIRSKPIVNKKKSIAQVKMVKTSIIRRSPSRMPAGDAVRPNVSRSVAQIKPKSRIHLTTRTKIVPPRAGITITKTNIVKHQKQRQPPRTLPKTKSHTPALEHLLLPKRSSKKKAKRLSAGSMLTKQATKPKKQLKIKIKPWYNPYQFQGGAGATYQPTPKPKVKPLLPTLNSIRRLQKKRSQERLAKHLEREEAIDDLERLEASSMRRFRLKHSSKGGKRGGYKISARLQELALPRNRYVSEPSTMCNSVSALPLYRPLKRRLKQRVQMDSSMGSLAPMKHVASRTETLSPAKRNLALAFMSNDGSRSPRYKRSVLWR